MSDKLAFTATSSDTTPVEIESADAPPQQPRHENHSEKDLVLNPNYVFRGRIHLLAAQNAHYAHQLNFSDAKGATLIALIGVLTVNTPFDVRSIDAPTLAFLALVGGAMVFALSAIIPKVPKAETRQHIRAAEAFSWPGLAEEAIDDYADRAQSADANTLISWIARSNAATPRILLKKFKRLQAAFICAALSLVPYAMILVSAPTP